MWDIGKRKIPLTEADNFTVLGKDVKFKGVARFEGTVQIESCFEGEIHTTGVLVVGEHAVIRGTITAGTLISKGKIRGNVTASDRVQLLKSAVLIGDVDSPAFSIEEGAYFKGFSDMGTSSWTDESPRSTDTPPGLTTRRSEPPPLLIENESENQPLRRDET
jgi:cytoskeletal protein CcmA (bactofilin family)